MDTHSYLSLCTGAGGLDLGVINGSSGTAIPVCYVERELTSCAVLGSNIQQGTLPDAPIWSDLTTFDFRQWDGVEGLVGGYPCQPFSTAGAKLGHLDTEKHLFPYIEAGIKAIRPVWCFFENVSGHLNLGFDIVAESLLSMGYELAATLVSAESVRASHHRERLFILAYSSGNRRKEKTFSVPRTSSRPAVKVERRERFAPGPKNDGWMDVPRGLQPSLAQSEFLRMADGDGHWLDLSRQDRIRIIGNGVVADCAALAWDELWDEVG